MLKSHASACCYASECIQGKFLARSLNAVTGLLQEMERLHGDVKNKGANPDTKRQAAMNHSNNTNMDSRRSHFGQNQHSNAQS